MSALPIQFSRRGSLQSISQEISAYAEGIAKSRGDLLGMNIGAPGTGAPKVALDALSDRMYDDVLGYSSVHGILPLRERISQMYQADYGISVSPENIIITYGASSAVLVSCVALLDVHDKIAVPLPCYNNYLVAFQSLGLKLKYINTTSENNFCITIDDLKALPSDIKAIILVNPSNPTGSVIPPDEYKKIIDYCEQRGIVVISDEIYHNITYGPKESITSALTISNNVIVLNSFSKYYSMPGWRVGWMVVPDNLVDQIQSVSRSFFVAPPTPSQYVALKAMDCTAELDEHVGVYRKNREIMLEHMPRVGFDRFTNLDGAFYFYAHIADFHDSSVNFCKQMIKEAGVIATPGIAFDPVNGHEYVRFSYAGTTASIEQAMQRLEQWRLGAK